MAYFGLRKPFIAKWNPGNTYTNGMVVGEAVSEEVNPNYAEGALYGDDKQVESEKEFSNADVTLGTTDLPISAASLLFGHEVSGTEIIYRSSDVAPYVGVGTVIPEKINGVRKYVALIIVKTQFAENAESYTTKGESITFSTPTISGKAITGDDDKWKVRKEFATEAEAETYVKNFLNIADTVAAPVASVSGGTYAAAQSVELSCATAGATIYYTTNGTTPSATNGTEYEDTAISVASSMVIRAIATKTSMNASSVMTEEYVIE